jgi:hypothetical protein
MMQFASRVGSPCVVAPASGRSALTDRRPDVEFDESSRIATRVVAEIYLGARLLRVVRNNGGMPQKRS